MSTTLNIDPKFLPNLPGFRPRPNNSGKKRHCFDVVNGQVFLRPDFIPENSIAEGSVASIGSSIVQKARKQLSLEQKVVLNFLAYFEEVVDEKSPPQVRYCNIYFYCEDGSVKVVEKPQINSGVPQGTLVKRAIIPNQDGSVMKEDDFHVGRVIVIYGRSYQ